MIPAVMFSEFHPPGMWRLGEQVLHRFGYRVMSFTDPVKALEHFKKDPHGFDLVVTDMTMPGMTGDRLAKTILRIA